MNSESRCPICWISARSREHATRDASTFDCRRCGRFTMTGRLIRAFTNDTLLDAEAQRLKPYLSAHTKQMSAAGHIPILDTEDSAETKNWRVAARDHAETPVPERIMKLLRLFADRSAYTGDLITIDSQHDYPMIDAIRADELFFLLDQLRSRGDIEWPLSLCV